MLFIKIILFVFWMFIIQTGIGLLFTNFIKDEKNNIVLEEATAKELFGTADVTGKTLKLKYTPAANSGDVIDDFNIVDEEKNNETVVRKGNEGVISTDNSSIPVYVLGTDEELMIARDTYLISMK